MASAYISAVFQWKCNEKKMVSQCHEYKTKGSTNSYMWTKEKSCIFESTEIKTLD